MNPSAPRRSHARGGALQRGRCIPSPPLRVWVWAAATVALLLVATLLWRGSDAAATQSSTAPPAGVPSGTPAAAVSEAWVEAALPERTVVQSGRVLVGSEHGVRALDPATGEETWHYMRSNARMCGLTATDGVAVAVFATADRCDEAVALNAGTGVRAWTRSVSFAGDVTISSTDRIVLAANPTGIVTVDPTGDNIRWRYAAPAGCRFLDAVAGRAGVAVLQRCAGATLAQVRLFDGFAGGAHWTRDIPLTEGTELRLLGADTSPTVLVDDEVQVLSAADGAVLTRLPLTGDDVQVGAAGDLTLVLVDGTLVALDAATGGTVWTAPALGLPAPPTVDGKDARSPAALLVPEDDGFVRRDPATGTGLGRVEAADVPAGGVSEAVGPVVVLRLPDDVRAYR